MTLEQNESSHIDQVPTHRSTVTKPIQTIGDKRVAVTGEEVIGFVLKVASASRECIVPCDCSPLLGMPVVMLACVPSEVWRKAALFSTFQIPQNLSVDRLAEFRLVVE